MEHTVEVSRNHSGPGFHRHGAEQRVAVKPGRLNQNVEPTMPFHDGGDRSLPISRLRHIQRLEPGPVSLFAGNFASHRSARMNPKSHMGGGPPGQQLSGHRSADATIGPGDQGNAG